ncbi:glycosyltransferase family 4 protein [Rhodoferax sp. U2-2l]|uniref:glycosyltransferase family 4 protein n=1 Tax=Rhodoferax sp. U2-2l TaxID=2884000 RepID=UPI001D0BC28C|nr:glycosyltransferase family 4 protein [Rhodoferax sp. U2-2l]MCB8746900.1 glycosyltransferase family 4 protein [Rhodoferax sp. U2-2l]
MKVVHVVRQYLPSIGGMEEVVRNLVQYQQTETPYAPSVITLDRVFRAPDVPLPPSDILDGIPVQRLPYRGSERYPLCPQVLGALREADLVHVHGIDFFFDYLALTRWLHGKPLIVSTHGGFFHTLFAQRLKRVYFNTATRVSARAYQRVIATSDNDGQIFSQVVGRDRLMTIENGVDIQKFDDASSRALQPVLIYFGRWSVNKGILEALDIVAALTRQQPDTPWQLIIAGREYDLHTETLLAHASQRGLSDRVQIVSSPTSADLRHLIGKASYFICMSRHEGFGIAPIEALSAGLVPILSAIAPFKRLVENTGVGLILEPASPDSQAHQVASLHARQGAQADSVPNRREAARRAAAPYSWGGVAAAYVQQYDAVMAP